MTTAQEALSSLREMNTRYGEEYGYHARIVEDFIIGHMLDEQDESVQCPECSGMGELYYRHADDTLDCMSCGGSGVVRAGEA